MNVYCYPCRLPYLPPFPMIGGYFTFAELSFLFLLISLCFLHGQEILKDVRSRGGKKHDSDLTVSELQQVVHEFKKLATVPEDPWKQLHEAMEAVFNSWLSARAISYRDIHNIPGNLGTAITVQSMVYGNMNVNSGSGVAFTRNPSTGALTMS